MYIARTREVRTTDQLFVCLTNPVKGKALSKQRLSHWVVEAISRAYACKNVQMPSGVHAHSTGAWLRLGLFLKGFQ